MIRYAAHRVYVQSEHRLHSRQMVELDTGGRVVAITPFAMEVHHTVWIDGLIVVSAFQPDQPLPDETFDSYMERVLCKEDAVTDTEKKRAYQITGFDIPAMRFTWAARVKQLG